MTAEPELAAEWVPVEALRAWSRNPRLITDAQIERVADSIKRFGFSAPIVARRQDGEVIAGHTRLRAAMKLGLAKVPVRYMALDPSEAHLLALADNRLTELTDWNEPELAGLLGEYGPSDALMAGWNAEDLTSLSTCLDEAGSGAGGPEADATEDLVPELPTDPVTKPGDLWRLGQHVLVCGDCRDPLVVARLFEGGERANVAFTSPPYASQRKYDESSGFKPIRPDEFVSWFEAVQANVRAHLAPDGSWFVNIKEHCDDGQRSLYVKDLTLAHAREWRWRFVDELCWVRGGVPGRWENRFKNGWEPVFHFTTQVQIKFRPDHVAHESERVAKYSPDNPKTHSGFLSGSASTGEGMALPSNVVRVHSGPAQIFESSTGEKHTATFPVGLPSFFLRAFSDVGDLVYDPFLGSGTTLIAAEQLERHAVGCELSPAYCDVIVERWQNLSGLSATREPAT